MRRTTSTSEPSRASLREIPEADFTKRVRRNPYAARMRADNSPAGIWPAIELYASLSSPKWVLLFTKDYLPHRWLAYGFPEHVDAFVHYGPVSGRQGQLLRAHAAAAGTAIRFVGDLDPLDLTVFANLRGGGEARRPRPTSQAPFAYAGIDDQWLRMCEKEIGSRNLSMVCIRQEAAERRMLAKLERSGLDLEVLVGPRCAALLRDGLKLEIEGASNPGIYGNHFVRRLLRRLLRR